MRPGITAGALGPSIISLNTNNPPPPPPPPAGVRPLLIEGVPEGDLIEGVPEGVLPLLIVGFLARKGRMLSMGGWVGFKEWVDGLAVSEV
jgi:hypothetical protein